MADISAPLPKMFTATTKGLVPASGGGPTKVLRADGTWGGPPTNYGQVNALTLGVIF